MCIRDRHNIARSKMQNAENAREHLRPRTSPSSFMKHNSGEGASICSSQRGLVGVAQHRNAVCLFALRTWQSRRASGCSVTPEPPVAQGSACGRLHCANTSGSTNCRQRLLRRLLSLSERRHGIAIGTATQWQWRSDRRSTVAKRGRGTTGASADGDAFTCPIFS